MPDARYAVVRVGGQLPDIWESLSSVMFRNVDDAWDFASKLDYAQVYRLEPVERPRHA